MKGSSLFLSTTSTHVRAFTHLFAIFHRDDYLVFLISSRIITRLNFRFSACCILEKELSLELPNNARPAIEAVTAGVL